MTLDPLDETIAEILDGLGETERAAMVRTIRSAADLHDECTDSDSLGAILSAVPDHKPSMKHDDACWHRHAACLRDKIYKELGWE